MHSAKRSIWWVTSSIGIWLYCSTVSNVLSLSICTIHSIVPPFWLMSSENDKDSSDPTAESTAATGKGMKTKKNMPSTSTNTVWKSNDDAMLIATLLKEREEGCQSDSGFEPKSFIACAEALKSSEKMSVWIAKSSGSCHNHWGKVCLLFNNSWRVLTTVLSAQKGLRRHQKA